MKEKRKLAVIMACSLVFAQSISLCGAKGLEETEAKGMQTFTVYRGKSSSLTITQKGKKKKTGKRKSERQKSRDDKSNLAEEIKQKKDKNKS